MAGKEEAENPFDLADRVAAPAPSGGRAAGRGGRAAGRGGPRARGPAAPAAPAPPRPPPRAWTEAEIAEKLEGYLEVPPPHWAALRYGTHVRYATAAGEYRPGGFVMLNPYDIEPRGTGVVKRFIKMANGFNSKAPGYASWIQAYEDIGRIFMKPDAGLLVVRDQLEEGVRLLNANIKKLSAFAKLLDERVAALEQARR